MSSKKTRRGYVPAPRRSSGAETENLVGFVALVDVLGFRELVGRADFSDVLRYVETATTCLEDDKYDQLQFVLFSDNLVINTRDDRPNSFASLVRACSDVLFNLAEKQIAVRGAIAHGQFVRSLNPKHGIVLAGRPIVEANGYEHSQNWMGIMLTPSVVKSGGEGLLKDCGTVPPPIPGEDEAQWLDRISVAIRLTKWDRIPFHIENSVSNSCYDGFAIVPIRPSARSHADIARSLASAVQYLQTMKSVAPNPAAQSKYSEAMQFLERTSLHWNRSRPSFS